MYRLFSVLFLICHLHIRFLCYLSVFSSHWFFFFVYFLPLDRETNFFLFVISGNLTRCFRCMERTQIFLWIYRLTFQHTTHKKNEHITFSLFNLMKTWITDLQSFHWPSVDDLFYWRTKIQKRQTWWNFIDFVSIDRDYEFIKCARISLEKRSMTRLDYYSEKL